MPSDEEITRVRRLISRVKADLANTLTRLRRQNAHVKQLERRLSEALGEQAWRRATSTNYGSGSRSWNSRSSSPTAWEERDQELDAARAANRELMPQLNTAGRCPAPWQRAPRPIRQRC
ncbi:hypothetical protein SK803_12325 [Lentzea sp. BCCO 10_0856]|uniref:Uncharacterized protein n=1 Tax=Lentzea miocenica TaxID=3095431 RepID=A0ABU4SYM8_9PSEU|nr:hypothetical protein [Lentzea sp. BCCO 10_0856]MDX8031006.1 hypothetical protein [Lentzea sp. BCCO 10_0856]